LDTEQQTIIATCIGCLHAHEKYGKDEELAPLMVVPESAPEAHWSKSAQTQDDVHVSLPRKYSRQVTTATRSAVAIPARHVHGERAWPKHIDKIDEHYDHIPRNAAPSILLHFIVWH